MPVYNIADYIEKCLTSLVRQTCKDIEILCVDDGSTDKTPILLKQLALYDKRIHVIEQENQGLGAARNVGLAQARGVFVGFVDGDDFVAQDMFEKLLDKAVTEDADVVIGGVKFYYSDYRRHRLFQNMNDYRILAKEGAFTAQEHPEILENNVAWNRIYRRSFLTKNQIKFPTKRIYEDVCFTFKSSVLARRIAVVPELFYYYRQDRPGSILMETEKQICYAQDYLKNFGELKHFLKEQGVYADFQRVFMEFQCYNARDQMRKLKTRGDFFQFCYELEKLIDPDDLKVAAEITPRENLLSNAEKPVKLQYMLRCLRKRRFEGLYWKIKAERLFNYKCGTLHFRLPRQSSWHKLRFPWALRYEVEMENMYISSL